MKNLIIFGDSFSTHYSTDNSVFEEDSWPVLLSKKINYNLKNYSLVGASNGEIINSFFKKYGEINSGDIVIIEVGFFNRIFEQFSCTTFIFGQDNDRFNKIEIDYFTEKLNNLDKLIEQDLVKFEFICEYLKQRKINFFIWFIDGNIDGHTQTNSYNQLYNSIFKKFSDNILLFDDHISFMDEVIEKKSNFWVKDSDKHLNKIGHYYFYEFILNKIKAS